MINVYTNIVTPPVVKGTIEPNQWFNKIKSSDYSHLIEKVRQGILDYKNIKESIPCVTYNFLYKKYKKDNNIITSTGLMYIDIDIENDINNHFDINLLDKTKIYCYYKSFRGKGYAILVKVNNLNKYNFKNTYIEICKELNIIDFIDTNAIKPSQFSVLSYDKDIYINNNCFIFNSEDYKNTPPRKVINNNTIEEDIYGRRGGKIIYNNIEQIFKDNSEANEPYLVNMETGYDFINCYIPVNKVKDGYRYKSVLSYTTNYVYINPSLTKESVLNTISNVNNVMCEHPMDYKQVIKIVNSVYKQKEDGVLVPIYSDKKRNIVFNEYCGYATNEKKEIVLTLVNEHRVEKTKQKLYDIIENWDFYTYGKISQSKIIKNHPISKKSVEKYYKEYIDYINDLNNDYKNGNK